MCTSFGSASSASAGRTWWTSAATVGFTYIGAVQLPPPSSDRTKRMLEPEFGSPNTRLVEFDQARYSTPLRAANAGWMVSRVAWTKVRRPNRPGVNAPARIARRTPPLRQSTSSPGWVTVSSVGSGALASLKARQLNVSPASSDASTWRKSWSVLLKRANGMYRRPVTGSTTGLVNWSEFCGCDGVGSGVGAKMVFVVQVAPPSVDRPKRSCWPVDWKLVQVT